MNISGDPSTEVTRVFPYGASASTEASNQPDFQMAGLECKPLADGRWTMRGWAYPNKAMYFDLENATETGQGWIVYHGSTRYLLRPLDQAAGAKLKAMLGEVY